MREEKARLSHQTMIVIESDKEEIERQKREESEEKKRMDNKIEVDRLNEQIEQLSQQLAKYKSELNRVRVQGTDEILIQSLKLDRLELQNKTKLQENKISYLTTQLEHYKPSSHVGKSVRDLLCKHYDMLYYIYHCL